MAKIPDKDEHTRQFAKLDTGARRDILKAVNRGRAVEDRRLAHLVVGVARRQQKFWKRAWIVGPIVGASSFIGATSVTAAAINAAIATLGLGLMSWLWYSRATRAEEINLQLALGPKRADRERAGQAGDDLSAGQRFRSHLPGRPSSGGGAPRPAGSAGPTTNGSSLPAGGTAPTPPGQRPYRPRGRKRR